MKVVDFTDSNNNGYKCRHLYVSFNWECYQLDYLNYEEYALFYFIICAR